MLNATEQNLLSIVSDALDTVKLAAQAFMNNNNHYLKGCGASLWFLSAFAAGILEFVIKRYQVYPYWW